MIFRKHSRLALILFTVLIVSALGLTQCQSKTETDNNDVQMTVQRSAWSPEADLKTAIARVARENIPAVVHIDVTQQQEVTGVVRPFSSDPLYQFFFQGPQQLQKFKQELNALGTGMLIDDKGNILTNNHVVNGATTINVLLADGTSYPATLVGTDPKTDLAVIHIKADEKLPHITFGDSDKLEVGNWVVAIGHPQGLDQTVTQGIISAKHRRGVLDPTTYQDYLQTDAAINPGNSGGPLLDLDGEVIGVNAAIASQSGGFEGIGFAIPSNMAVHVARALIDHGKVTRGWMGVSIGDPTPDQIQSLKLQDHEGALVADVVPGGPAEAAGLQKDDLVTTYRGQKIEDTATLRSSVADTPVGEKVDLTVIRNGETVDLTVKVGNMEDAMKKIAASLKDRLGVVLRAVNDQETENYNLQSGVGVAIDSVDPDGLLGKAGFEKDDLILSINNTPVEGVEEFVDIIDSLPARQQVLLQALDHRTGRSGYLQVTIG